MSFFDSLRELTFGSMALRLFLAMLCGGVLGYGRSKKERPAGLRTYMLVCLAATAAVLLSLYEYKMMHSGPWAALGTDIVKKFDVARIAAQTVSGIGFIGAGIIIKATHQQVSGLTTATGLFAAVCMGLACGVGFYECVIPAVVIIHLVLNIMSPLEGEFKRKLRNMTLSVEYNTSSDLAVIEDVLKKMDATVYDVEIERAESTERHHASAIFILKMSPENRSHSGILTSVAELPCVHNVAEIIA